MTVFLLAVLATCTLLLRVRAAEGHLRVQERDLREYDGTDNSKPIYLAINGTIFDVSASPAFYGPGGHYHHFVGRDATRGWLTECWDSEDQLTWRMDGVESMFLPKYLDEELEKAAEGEGMADLDIGMVSSEHVMKLAKEAARKLGKVSEAEKAKRRVEDEVEAKQKVHDTLAHWIRFFENNAKYSTVGSVIYDHENSKAPPEICEAALKKRPVKGGKLDSLMNVAKDRTSEDHAGGPQSVNQAHEDRIVKENDAEKDEL